MRGLCSRQVLNKIREFKSGSVFSWRDVAIPRFSAGTVQRALSRLEAQSKIKRYSQGMYYLPKETLVGPSRASDEAVLQKLLLEKRARDQASFGNERIRINRLIPVGATLFYEMGLTTQVPVQKSFIAPVRFSGNSKALKVVTVPMEKYQDLSDSELKSYLALVSLYKIGNESSAEVALAFKRFLKINFISRSCLRDICTRLGGQKGRKAIRNLEFVFHLN